MLCFVQAFIGHRFSSLVHRCFPGCKSISSEHQEKGGKKEIKEMTDRKNAKYIVADLVANPDAPEPSGYSEFAKRVLWMNNKIVPGAYNFMASWYLKPPKKRLEAHVHDYPEVIIFMGSDPEAPHDLGGEIEFWLEDEQYVLTRSCFIFVPSGLRHCPMVVRRVDRPIMHLGSSVRKDFKM
jgi:hypothetical protein